MLSEPKYKHNVMNANTGHWYGGSDNWDVARAIIQEVRRQGMLETGARPQCRIITFHGHS